MTTWNVSSAAQLAHALGAAAGGDTILLGSGDYDVLSVYDLHFDDYVTIKSADGNGGASFSRVLVDNSSYLRMEDVHVEFPSNPTGSVAFVSIHSSDHIQLVDSEVNGPVDDNYDGGRGIFVDGGSHDLLIQDNYVHDARYGNVFFGAHDFQVIGNTYEDLREDTMKFAGVSDVLIENNTGPKYYHSGVGDHQDFMQFQGSSHDVVIRGNVALPGVGSDPTYQGIFMKIGTYDNILIEDNVIVNGNTRGISVSEGSNVTIVNNTLLTIPDAGDKASRVYAPSGSTVSDNVWASYAGDAGWHGSNLVLQYENPNEPFYYNDVYDNAMEGLGITIDDLRPVAGGPADFGTGLGAEERIQALLSGDSGNLDPIASDDAATTHSPVTIDVLANDTDPDGDTLQVTSASAENGDVVINPDETVTYTPHDGFSGEDILTYSISDGHGGSDSAKVTITVPEETSSGTASGDNAPDGAFAGSVIEVRASGDQYKGAPQFQLLVDGQQVGDVQTVTALHDEGEWQTFTFNVDAPDGFDEVRVVYLQDAYGGTADTDRNLYVDWIQINDVGIDSEEATYRRAWGSEIDGRDKMSWKGALIFDVSDRDDLFSPLENTAPTAADDIASTSADTSVTFAPLANDTDPDGDWLSIAAADADNGTVTINADNTLTYTPPADFDGDDTITYTVSDGRGGTDTATVSVAVDSVNGAPQARNDVATTHSPVTIDVLANDSDPDNDTLEVTSASAENGDVVINPDETVTYTPHDGFSGEDILTYSISDGHGGSDSATVAVTVPEAGDGGASEGSVIEVRASGDQYRGAPQFQLLVDGQQVGDVQTVTALHDEGEWQTFTFNVDAPDGFDEVRVVYLQDAYGGSADKDRNLYVDEIQINGVEIDSEEATYRRSWGSEIDGRDKMSWKGTLIFDVSDRPDLFEHAPAVDAQNDFFVAEDGAISDLDVLANDLVSEGGSAHLVSAAAAHGTVWVSPENTLSYMPEAGFVGADGITYAVSDGQGGTDLAFAAVLVEDSPDPILYQEPVSFDGDPGQAIVLPDNDLYALGQGTLEMAFTVDNLNGLQGLFSKDASGYASGGHLSAYLDHDDLVIRLQTQTDDHYLRADNAIIAGEDHHMAVTFGDGGMMLYLDGAQVASNSFSGGLDGNGEPIVIGASQMSSTEGTADQLTDGFDGTISKVALYGEALPPTQIALLMDGDSASSLFADAGLEAWMDQSGVLDDTGGVDFHEFETMPYVDLHADGYDLIA